MLLVHAGENHLLRIWTSGLLLLIAAGESPSACLLAVVLGAGMC